MRKNILVISAAILSLVGVSESWATTGCVKDGSYVRCYNASGKQIFSLTGNSYTCSGNSCSTNTGDTINYNPSTNQISERKCRSHSSGVCTRYLSASFRNQDYTYDEQGNQISIRTCLTVNTDGSCNGYSSGSDYTYDPTTGKQTSSRSCNSVNTDGSCNGYSGGTYYTYDPTTGNQTSYKECGNYSSSGECLMYTYATNTTYDENGKARSHKGCYFETINTSQGECISYAFGSDYI